MGGVAAQPFHHTIRGAVPHQQRQGSAALGQGFTQISEELVVDADVAEGTGRGAGSSTNGQSNQRVEEQHADQHTPETAAHRTGGRQIDRLAQVHMAILAMLQHHGIFERDQMLLLNGHQLEPHLLSFLDVGKADHNQIRHGFCATRLL